MLELKFGGAHIAVFLFMYEGSKKKPILKNRCLIDKKNQLELIFNRLSLVKQPQCLHPEFLHPEFFFFTSCKSMKSLGSFSRNEITRTLFIFALVQNNGKFQYVFREISWFEV